MKDNIAWKNDEKLTNGMHLQWMKREWGSKTLYFDDGDKTLKLIVTLKVNLNN